MGKWDGMASNTTYRSVDILTFTFSRWLNNKGMMIWRHTQSLKTVCVQFQSMPTCIFSRRKEPYTQPPLLPTKMQLPSGRVRRICWKRSTRASTWGSSRGINEKVVDLVTVFIPSEGQRLKTLKSSLRFWWMRYSLILSHTIPIHQRSEWSTCMHAWICAS